MAFGLTNEGFVKKRIEDILSELQDAFRSAFGDGIDLNPTGPVGQIISIFADREAEIWDLAEAVYYSQYPDTASGISLDNAAGLTGNVRESESFSVATVVFSGDNGTVIPQGFEIYRAGSPGVVFITLGTATISAGTATTQVRSREAGPISALAGTLTGIVSNINGIGSVTNPTDAIPGSLRESDSAFRLRRLSELQTPGTSAIEGIRTAVLTLDGVDEVLVVENSTSSVDAQGRPPKSFETYVSDNGTVNETLIAQAIFDAKPAGIETHGTIVKTVSDSQGFTYNARFSRPANVNIWVKCQVQGNTDPLEGDIFPADGLTQIRNAILAYGSTLRMGRNIIHNRLAAAISNIPGVVEIQLLIGISETFIFEHNVEIGSDQIAKFDSTRITVSEFV